MLYIRLTYERLYTRDNFKLHAKHEQQVVLRTTQQLNDNSHKRQDDNGGYCCR